MKTFLKDCRWGRFLLLRGDMISIFADLYGEWSELELRLFKTFLSPDSNIVEVGANLGLHSVPLAKFASGGKVVCFEPQRIVFQLLCANIALNDLTNVFAYNIAASDEERELAIQSSDYETPWNYGAFSLAKGMSTEGSFPGPVSSEQVTAVRLDTFRPVNELRAIALLKIDAEGHELAVLEGTAGLVARHRPVIFLENNSEQQGDALIRRVESLGYRPYWFCDERYQPDNFNRVGIKVPGFDVNMICFPAEREPCAGLMPAITFADLRDGKVPLARRVS
jgi:FkbM family methyltransferase